MLELFNGLFQDYLAAKGFALPSTTGAVGLLTLGGLMRKRTEVARLILLEEIRHGQSQLEFGDKDEAAAILYRYVRAAEEGAARRNLRLLAAVISGRASGPGLYADDFLRWADVLSGLRYEEILVLSVIQQMNAREPDGLSHKSPLTKFWNDCLDALKENHRMEATQASAYAASLMRTGMVTPVSDDFFSGIVFTYTHLFIELTSLMAIEGVLSREQHS